MPTDIRSAPPTPPVNSDAHPGCLLIVEDDAAMRQMCCDLFQRRNHHTVGVGGARAAMDRIRAGLGGEGSKVRLVLTDVRLGRDANGIELLREIKAADPELPVLIMTGYATVPDAVESMKRGAADYVTKPFERAELIEKVEAHLRPESEAEEGASDRLLGMVGKSEPMQRLFDRIRSAGRSEATVLITGESGTGKELVARAIHRLSDRKDSPFVPVNCAALPEHLIESELFGHEAGSFTGATKEGKGLFRAAEGGTIFLDEVVDMPKDIQAKLLRVLQDRRVRPVGSTRETPVDVRVIAATNWDVDRARTEGVLRDDLFYRLSVVRLYLPPLRERHDDLVLLLDHLLAKHAKRSGRRIRKVDNAALARLLAYPWPGNVRELESVVESAYAFGKNDTLYVEDLPEWVLTPPAANQGPDLQENRAGAAPASAPAAQPLTLSDMEKEALNRALAVAQGNKSKAAQLLGVSRKRLYRMLNDYGLAGDEPDGEA